MKLIGNNFNDLVVESIKKMRNESNNINQKSTKTLKAWKNLMASISEIESTPTEDAVQNQRGSSTAL